VADFGFAANFKTDTVTNKYSIGTQEFLAPELLIQGKTHNQLVDIWAVAVIAYLFLTTNHPFENKADGDKTAAIFCSEPDHTLLWKYTPEARDFISKGLTKSRSKRPSALDLLSHPWLSSVQAQAAKDKQVLHSGKA